MILKIQNGLSTGQPASGGRVSAVKSPATSNTRRTKVAVSRKLARASGNHPPKIGQTCGWLRRISQTTSTPSRSNISAIRRVSSSNIYLSPTVKNTGGAPVNAPNNGETCGSEGSCSRRYICPTSRARTRGSTRSDRALLYRLNPDRT